MWAEHQQAGQVELAVGDLLEKNRKAPGDERPTSRRVLV
jgi:hypothetical protein